MYFHPTYAALSSSSAFSFSTSSAYPPSSASPPHTSLSSPTSSSSSPSSASPSIAAACYVLSTVSWDGHKQADEYRRSLALIAHNVVFLCRAAGMSDTVRLWRVGGNLMDLLQAVSIGLNERRRQERVNEKAERDEQWMRQRDREEKEQEEAEQHQQQQEAAEAEQPTGEVGLTFTEQVPGGKLDSGGLAGVVRFAAIAVANVNADDAEWDLVETEQLDEWDEKEDKHEKWTNGHKEET